MLVKAKQYKQQRIYFTNFLKNERKAREVAVMLYLYLKNPRSFSVGRQTALNHVTVS